MRTARGCGLVVLAVFAVVAVWLAPCASAQGAAPVGASAVAPADATAVVYGERLSDWLLRNTDDNREAGALHWRVRAQRAPQERLRQAVLADLNSAAVTTNGSDLAQFVQGLPLTGRLPVVSTDPRWLQAAPGQDPVLEDGQTLVWPARARTVAVLGVDGKVCLAVFRAGSSIGDYVTACDAAQGDVAAHVVAHDWAWLVQADGTVRRFGVAQWNASVQDVPGPGAWIWAPPVAAQVGRDTSENLARFLATQLPAEMLLPNADAVTLHDAPEARGYLRDLALTASDWGEIGVLQTPSARMDPAGMVRFNLSRVDPYQRGNLMLQPLDGMEVGFRYTMVLDQLYGPSIAGGQAYVDKSMDLKLRLREEDAAGPQLAVGLIDLTGTGLFSSEYVVGSRRYGNWDTSVGVAWGYLGSRDSLHAPLAFLGSSFATRPAVNVGSGGQFNFSSMFHGDAAPFGGVQWHAPNDPWLFKLELDSNNYSQEPFGTTLPASSPFNVGVVYRYSPSMEFSAGWERGNQLMLGVTFRTDISKTESPKVLDPVLPLVRDTRPVVSSAFMWDTAAAKVHQVSGWQVLQLSQYNDTATLVAETDGALFLQNRIDRVVTVLHQAAPASVRHFVLLLQEQGVDMSRVDIDRAQWVAERARPAPPALRVAAQQVVPASAVAGTVTPPLAAQDPSAFVAPPRPATTIAWSPSYSQILGGPDAFVLYQVGVQASLKYAYSPSTWFSGMVNGNVLNNYNLFTYDAPSNLPRVRTYAREYATTSVVTFPVLQWTHVEALGGGHYASVYGGMLESMFGGVGGEWLYRPWHSPLAFGMDANYVRQRGFAQDVSFRDYDVVTGHAAVYWDTGWNDVRVTLKAGQYLAGDVGATLDVSRTFSNGTAMGAWITQTNVSAEQFGEGSFDKGLYLRVPLDVILPMSSASIGSLVWDPLTRDGGAMLNRQFTLFNFTSQQDRRSLDWSATPLSDADHRFRSDLDNDGVTRTPTGWLDASLQQAGGMTRQLGDVPMSTWLWGGALVLASAQFDSQVNQWAQNHQDANWTRVGTMANEIPYALALGTGVVLLTGSPGDGASTTARTSVVAAAYTLGVNAIAKMAVGRARPSESLGPDSFSGFGGASTQSSFASDHVAAAFALATPFARAYDEPWLYGLAGLSAVGRIQSGAHWLSDTVAGGFMGYAMGSIGADQQLGPRKATKVVVTPQSVAMNWAF